MAKKSSLTIADIARLANVSKSTVSRALNDSPLIAEETKERIRAIAREHNFRLNAPARRLSLRQSNTIAYVTHSYHDDFSLTDLFVLEILGSITHELSRSGYDLLVVRVDPRDTDWADQYLSTGKVDGFILMTSTRKRIHIQKLVKLGAPFIIWGVPSAGTRCSSVTGDNFNGGKLAASHLIRIGRKRIAFLGGPEDELEVQGRFDGYRAALEEAGMPLDPALLAYGDWSDVSGAEAMRRLLEQAPDLDAVFVNGDLMAVAAMKTAQELGRRVPEDIAVVGYDDLSIAAFSSPPLSTVRQNIPLAGQLLARTLIGTIQTGAISNITVPVELVVRQSA